MRPLDAGGGWEGSDGASGIDHYALKINNNDFFDVNSDTSYTLTDLEDGEYTIYIKVVDKAGNYQEATMIFSIDTTKPELQSFVISQLDYDFESGTMNFNCSWQAFDDGSGIDFYYFNMDNDNNSVPIYDSSILCFNVNIGFHTFYVKVYDKVGNYNEFTYKTRINPSYEGKDTDSDGLPDVIDPDDDNDGYTDREELDAGTDPLNDEQFPKEHKDVKSEESGGFGIAEGGVIAIIILSVLILLFLFLKRGKGFDPLSRITRKEQVGTNIAFYEKQNENFSDKPLR